ncbi:MAG TPA: transcriptional repressor [Solirubrobacterales bacterium]|nr:transcriptional repressor [Solirubrobacterales bacterium]
MTADAWSDTARRAMGGEGHRIGGAREAVVELLARQDCCLSAQQIADRLRSQGSGVGIASVYRTLDLLHGLGLVQRVDVGEGGQRYEPIVPGGEHHHHAVCDSCGEVTAFDDPRLEQAIERVSSRLGHAASGHDVVIRGTCTRCEHRQAGRRRAS